MSSTNRQTGGDGQRHLTIPASLVATFMYSSSDCMATLDAVGVIQHANPSWRAVMEVGSDADLDGLNWQDLWPYETRGEAVKAIQRAHARLTTRFTAQCRTLKGQLRWFDLTIGPVTDASGYLSQILVQGRDITAYKLRESDLQNSVTATEAALGALTRQLESESQRLAQATARAADTENIRLIGLSVGNIVHDFNNVLTVLSSSSRILHRGVGPQVQADVLDNIDRAIERGRLLVRHLLDLLRTDAAEPELIETPDFIDAIGHLAEHLFGGAITLQFDVEPSCWPVLARPSKLQAAFLGLLSNAAATLPDGGVAMVRVRNCPAGEQPAALPPGDYVHVAVGNAQAEQRSEPGAAASPAGTGLAEAVELAEQSLGRVIVSGAPGAVVNLYLPRAGSLAAAEIGHASAQDGVVFVDRA